MLTGVIAFLSSHLQRSIFRGYRIFKKWLDWYSKTSPLVMVPVIFAAGVIFWGGFNWSLELTNNEQFCVSCHVMRANVYEEYRDSVHFNNGSGVRATCPDCHVPKEWKDKVVRKIGATNELYFAMAGSINTREKFLGKRLELAGHVWETMEANDSLECRNCHEFESMDMQLQSGFAASSHARADAQKMTCIDCHKGIAHQLPESFWDSEHERFEAQSTACSNCHQGLQNTETWTDDEW